MPGTAGELVTVRASWRKSCTSGAAITRLRIREIVTGAPVWSSGPQSDV